MIVVMNRRSSSDHVEHVIALAERMGLASSVIKTAENQIVEIHAHNGHVDRAAIEKAPMVDRILDHADPLLASCRQPDDETTAVPLGEHATMGGRRIGVIAGPCTVESKSQLFDVAAAVKEAGAVALRGGAFKPRSSPYTFQGHGEQGLEWLALARESRENRNPGL